MSQTAIAILLGWALLVGLALLIRRLWLKPARSKSRIKGDAPPYAKPQGRVRRGTQQTLMTLLNGDRKTANRLLQDARFRYPGNAEHWYWEKVIYDLKRDRRT